MPGNGGGSTSGLYLDTRLHAERRIHAEMHGCTNVVLTATLPGRRNVAALELVQQLRNHISYVLSKVLLCDTQKSDRK